MAGVVPTDLVRPFRRLLMSWEPRGPLSMEKEYMVDLYSDNVMIYIVMNVCLVP